MLLLKLLLAPLIIVAVTLIGRRWGPRAAGLAAGLPVTTGPVSVFLALERGPAFAARAAGGTVAGLIATGAFCAAYAVVARRRHWPAALIGAFATLATVTLLLRESRLPFGVEVALALGALLLLWAGLGRISATEIPAARGGSPGTPRAWDLPARVLVSAAIVAGVTEAAGLLGPHFSGVLSALPVLATVVGTFTHRVEGRAAVIAMMRGIVIGCVSAVAFCAVIGAALAPGRLAATYAAAMLAALVAGAAASWLNRAPVAADTAGDDLPLALGKAA
jgi:hypothetical protein